MSELGSHHLAMSSGRPLQAFDAGGRARALSQLIEAMGTWPVTCRNRCGVQEREHGWGRRSGMKADVIEHALNVANRKERRARDARRARMGEKRYRALVLNLARVIRMALQERAVGSL